MYAVKNAAGTHTVDVQFVAGTPQTVLIRVRQIE